jgi:glutaredoxin
MKKESKYFPKIFANNFPISVFHIFHLLFWINIHLSSSFSFPPGCDFCGFHKRLLSSFVFVELGKQRSLNKEHRERKLKESEVGMLILSVAFFLTTMGWPFLLPKISVPIWKPLPFSYLFLVGSKMCFFSFYLRLE